MTRAGSTAREAEVLRTRFSAASSFVLMVSETGCGLAAWVLASGTGDVFFGA